MDTTAVAHPPEIPLLRAGDAGMMRRPRLPCPADKQAGTRPCQGRSDDPWGIPDDQASLLPFLQTPRQRHG